jgi:tRNA dimethylallyltransferase
LGALDPRAEARISSGDRQRLTRALAVARATGRPLSAWQAETRPEIAAEAWRAVVLEPPRDALYARIDARLTAMAEAGAIDEAAALMRRGLDPSLPAMKAVGLRELAAHAAGETTLDEAIAAARQATRRYAKRQLTWFRHQTPAWPRIEAIEADAQWEASTRAFKLA